jgi:hypothetical protein
MLVGRSWHFAVFCLVEFFGKIGAMTWEALPSQVRSELLRFSNEFPQKLRKKSSNVIKIK